MKPAAHLTCVGASRGEIRDTLSAYHGAGVRHIVALRGDPPTGLDAPYEAQSRRLSDDRGTRRRRERDRQFRGVGRDLSGKASAEPDAPARHRDPEAQGRGRRRPGDHPVLLRQQRLFSLSRRRRRGGHRDPDRAGNLSDAEFQADGEFRSPRRNERSALARRAVRRPRRRPERPAASSPPQSAPNRSST